MFFVWISGAAYLGIGVHGFGAAVDGIGYGIMTGDTSAKWIFLSSVPAIILALITARFRWRFGAIASFSLGLAMLVLVFILANSLLPQHFRELCDTKDLMRACDAATWRARDTCKPAESCFPRIEKACRLGSARSCSALMVNGRWTREQVCSALKARCDEIQACRPDGQWSCAPDDLPAMENLSMNPGCESYHEICGETAP